MMYVLAAWGPNCHGTALGRRKVLNFCLTRRSQHPPGALVLRHTESDGSCPWGVSHVVLLVMLDSRPLAGGCCAESCVTLGAWRSASRRRSYHHLLPLRYLGDNSAFFCCAVAVRVLQEPPHAL